jgi:hypothetical protein
MYRGWRVISYFPWRREYDDPQSAALARVETASNANAPAITITALERNMDCLLIRCLR